MTRTEPALRDGWLAGIDERNRRHLQRLFGVFAAAGVELFLVGGCVRDLLRGVRPKDYDLCSAAPPPAVKQMLADAGIRWLGLGEAFGTVAALIEGESYEITTFRVEESYRKGSRHPRVVFGSSLEADLGRRDLSLNAMALRLDGSLVDPFDGAADLAARRLSAPGKTVARCRETFADDPLRMLRVARFAATLDFAPADELTEAARALAGSVMEVSRERWKAELDKLLLGLAPERGLGWLRQAGVLGFCLPELSFLPSFTAIEARLRACPRELGVRWAALLWELGDVAGGGPAQRASCTLLAAELAEGVARRWRFSAAQREELELLVSGRDALRGLLGQPEQAQRVGLRRVVRRFGASFAALRALEALAGSVAELEALAELDGLLAQLEAARELRVELPRGIGHALMAEGWQGAALGEAIAELEDAQVEERLGLGADASACAAHLRSWRKRSRAGTN